MAKVLILGAGASYGHGVKGVSKPPMTNNFFNKPEFYSSQTFDIFQDAYRPLLNYIKEIYGLDLKNSDIENIFSKLEPFWNINRFDFEILQSSDNTFFWETPLDMLRSYVTDMILLTTSWVAVNDCPLHCFLASSWLSPGDTVISFNYDLIMDSSLMKLSYWSLSTGYGFKTNIWSSGSTMIHEDKNSEIEILKLHGSLNWFRSEIYESDSKNLYSFLSKTYQEENEFKQRRKIQKIGVCPIQDTIKGVPFDSPDFSENGRKYLGAALCLSKEAKKASINNTARVFTKLAINGSPLYAFHLPLIIMPTPRKQFDEMTFGELNYLWRKAKTAIDSSDEILAIGYSFRDEEINQYLINAGWKRKMESERPIFIKVVDPKAEKIIDEWKKENNNPENIIFKPFNKKLGDFVIELGYRGNFHNDHYRK